MPNIVNKTNPSQYQMSADPSTYSTDDWLESPPSLLTLIDTVPTQYWKLDVGETDVLEMDQAEKDAVDAAVDAARLASAQSSGKSLYDNDRDHLALVVRALGKLLVDELNTLRAEHSLTARTYAQGRTAIRNSIDAET